MTSFELWAPPNIASETLADKINEWIVSNPSKPPYKAFIQQYIDSTWPIMWHLKTSFKVNIVNNKVEIEQMPHNNDEICAICHCPVDNGTETLECNHIFHTMCIHRWLQYASTCPVCRTKL